MTEASEREVAGSYGRLVVRTWAAHDPKWIALLAHGHGEHSGRYEWLAERLTGAGAVVCAPDHVGHGHSAGTRAVIPNAEQVVADLEEVRSMISGEHPGLPVVLIGHSLGGMFATRYAQLYPDELAAVVLSAPVLGTWYMLDLLECDEIPDTPIDPATLSRDPAAGRDYVDDPLVWHGPFKRSTLRAVDRCLDRINTGPALQPPTLWLHGDDDELVPEADTRTGIDRVRAPEFQERIYVGARHEVLNETNREAVLEDLLHFVRRQLGS